MLNDCLVVGAGPAGIMAAIRAAELGKKTLLLEKNANIGNKLLLTGKGRCNLTNNEELEVFLKAYGKKGDFLRDAFKTFFNKELVGLLKKKGVKVKVERQERIFPESDKSASVLKAFSDYLNELNVKVVLNATASRISVEGGKVKGVFLKDGRFLVSPKVIIATGGVSFKDTGSTGDGLIFAEKAGHNIIDLRPGLVPLRVKEKFIHKLQGLTLKNVRITFKQDKKTIHSGIGEVLITHFGISGPLVLDLSSIITSWLKDSFVSASIDLKPGLSAEQLDKKFLAELSGNRKIVNYLPSVLPGKMVELFIEMLGFNPDKKLNQINKKERLNLVKLLKDFSFNIDGSLGLEEGMVTCGGVSLKEINPKTMQSRIVKGLYFAGEVIDIDAVSGGYNLQAAFSTGYLAGQNAGSNE
jgi:predicted Rossmann fold flavoprotein